MTWNTIDCFSQLRLKIVRDKCGDLFNNIGLTYQRLNMCVVCFTFLLRLKKYMHGIKRIFCIMQRKKEKTLITMHV